MMMKVMTKLVALEEVTALGYIGLRFAAELHFLGSHTLLFHTSPLQS